jgi:hypothetical protein
MIVSLLSLNRTLNRRHCAKQGLFLPFESPTIFHPSDQSYITVGSANYLAIAEVIVHTPA